MRDTDKYKNTRKMTRRDWLQEEWSQDVMDHVIQPIGIVPADLINPIIGEIAAWDYESFHTVLHIAKWPDNSNTRRLKSYFSQETIDDYLAFRSPPNHLIKPHLDPARKAGIYIPILPVIGYAPLEMYYNNEMLGVPENPEGCVMAYLWNPQILHSVFNNNCDRYNLQLSLSIPYSEARDKF